MCTEMFESGRQKTHIKVTVMCFFPSTALKASSCCRVEGYNKSGTQDKLPPYWPGIQFFGVIADSGQIWCKEVMWNWQNLGEETWSDDDFVNTVQTLKFSGTFVDENKLFLLSYSNNKFLFKWFCSSAVNTDAVWWCRATCWLMEWTKFASGSPVVVVKIVLVWKKNLPDNISIPQI